ncbi:ABC transporter permease, partial [bacterium]|nr:ABC transporter permease [bacterium]
MLKNLIRYSIRSFKRQRSYIIINILGLSIGIACSLLIALFVINEAGYDRYNVNRERIFRVVLNGKIGGQEVVGAFTPSIMGPTMLREVPEVEDFLRMTGRGPTIVEYNGQTFTEEACLEADSSFFRFFTIPVIKGDTETMLNAPHRIILTESTAKKIFGDEDPVDKALKLGTDTVRYIVTGVIGDIPPKSHFNANMITSF